jgi:hypothetical protein
VSENTKDVLLRIPLDLAAELEQAQFNERRTATRILLEGLAIRLRALQPENLDKVLEKIGYQEQRPPGRPPGSAVAAANGSAPAGPQAGPEKPPEDDWDLDRTGVS